MKKLIILIFCFVFILSLNVAYATTINVNECGVIDSPGHYVLTNDLIDVNEDCFIITANDVLFDCTNYSIYMDIDTAFLLGGNQENVVIENCNIYNGYAITNLGTNISQLSISYNYFENTELSLDDVNYFTFYNNELLDTDMVINNSNDVFVDTNDYINSSLLITNTDILLFLVNDILDSNVIFTDVTGNVEFYHNYFNRSSCILENILDSIININYNTIENSDIGLELLGNFGNSFIDISYNDFNDNEIAISTFISDSNTFSINNNDFNNTNLAVSSKNTRYDFYSNTVLGDVGFYLEGHGTNNIYNNIFYFYEAGVRIDKDSGFLSVTNNTFNMLSSGHVSFNNNNFAIGIMSGAFDAISFISIDKNTFNIDEGYGDVADYAINLNHLNSFNNYIYDNVFNLNSLHGINIRSSNEIIENEFNNCLDCISFNSNNDIYLNSFNSGARALRITADENNIMDNVFFTNNGIFGNSANVKDNIFADNTFFTTNNAINLRDSRDNLFIDNHIYEIPGGTYEIILGGSGIDTFENLVIGDGDVDFINISFDGRGIYLTKNDYIQTKSGYYDISSFIKVERETLSSDPFIDLKVYYESAYLEESEIYTLEMWRYNGDWSLVEDSGVNVSENYVYSGPISDFSVFAPLYSLFCGGNGTVNDPYLICTPLDLHNIRYEPTAYYEINNSLNLNHSILSSKSWYNDTHGWLPIDFNGSLNGNNHIIENLYINRPTYDAVGLFGYVNSNRNFENIQLINVNVTGHTGVGGLAGIVSEINTEYCVVTGNVHGIGRELGEHVIGGTGLMFGNKYGGTLTNSHTEGIVIGEHYHAGGLVGLHVSGLISNSSSYADVSGGIRIGGLVGRTQDSIIENSEATGDVTGYFRAGGFVGESLAFSINNSYATGDVYEVYVPLATDPNFIGGFVGENWQNISNSYATGNVYTPNTNGAGGFAGQSCGNIENSYSTGDVVGDVNVGGFIGNSVGYMNSCYTTSNVYGNNNVGGFVGVAGQANFIKNSYSLGNVVRFSGSLSENVGGFVGLNHISRIHHSYSIGSVVYEDAVNPTNKGFAGSVDVGPSLELVYNYWDIESSNQSSSAGEGIGEIEGRTTEEMNDVITFYPEWDIETINVDRNNGYPFLSWELSDSEPTWYITSQVTTGGGASVKIYETMIYSVLVIDTGVERWFDVILLSDNPSNIEIDSYQFNRINIGSFAVDNFDSAVLYARINSSWYDIYTEEIVFVRFENTDWVEYETTYIGTDGDYALFEVSVDGTPNGYWGAITKDKEEVLDVTNIWLILGLFFAFAVILTYLKKNNKIR